MLLAIVDLFGMALFTGIVSSSSSPHRSHGPPPSFRKRNPTSRSSSSIEHPPSAFINRWSSERKKRRVNGTNVRRRPFMKETIESGVSPLLFKEVTNKRGGGGGALSTSTSASGEVLPTHSNNYHVEEAEEEEKKLEAEGPSDTNPTALGSAMSKNDSKVSSESVPPKLPPQKEDEEKETDKSSQKKPTVTLHTYTDPRIDLTLTGLNVPPGKFRSWVDYTLQNANATRSADEIRDLTRTDETCMDGRLRSRLREVWKERRLISERTEMLAVYASETRGNARTSSSSPQYPQRGCFSDLLRLYADRLLGIVREETDSDGYLSQRGVVEWMGREYGEEKVHELRAENLLNCSQKVQFDTLQHFLHWFKERLPYYYDRCDTCGASMKDTPTTTTSSQENNDDEDGDDHDDHDDNTFLGYVYPTAYEIQGKASRTELYQCHICKSHTRFPRFNSADWILQSGKGRCGEYSMVLFRILRSLGFGVRWVVDWADHVWVEIYLKGRWVHLDPCEAAMDMPLLYEGWGKEQTFIIAFRADDDDDDNSVESRGPLIEDVTGVYTSDSFETISKRREESVEQVNLTLETVNAYLKEKLCDLPSSI